ncbi:hypothetical protein HMPREF6745_0946 [Prevotella sp. oral taxon 472 str. F0295]|nr:hypothetical protein HMPREF6745_0946 [Prevotella sp. oral taxon 472 str. F0295]
MQELFSGNLSAKLVAVDWPKNEGRKQREYILITMLVAADWPNNREHERG